MFKKHNVSNRRHFSAHKIIYFSLLECVSITSHTRNSVLTVQSTWIKSIKGTSISSLAVPKAEKTVTVPDAWFKRVVLSQLIMGVFCVYHAINQSECHFLFPLKARHTAPWWIAIIMVQCFTQN